MNISVVIGTFGDNHWIELAKRAIASAENQTKPALEVIHCHAENLHEARNQGAKQATGEWIVFLDADDELDEKYIESISEKVEEVGSDLWLIQPATLGVVDGREDPFPTLIPKRNSILDGNWMVIGTAVSRTVFFSVGGFKDFDMYEDWDLWIRCVNFGCKTTVCENAIYRVHVRNDSRNNQSQKLQTNTYNKIRNQYI